MKALNTLNNVNALNNIKAFRYNLDKTSKKYKCFGCGQKRMVRVVDNETGVYLPDHVGRCDRENGCGYEYTWKQYLADTGNGIKPFIDLKPIEDIKSVDYLPLSYLEKSLQRYEANNFYLYLVKLFGEPVAKRICKRYLIGTSGYWKGAVSFPQIDEDGNLHQLKIMLHNPETGKRIKENETVERLDRMTKTYLTEVTENPCSKIIGKFIDETTKSLNLQQCFFGQHLLSEEPNKEVCIVESEKTAVIASVYLPQFIWLATGGASGCKWREYEVYKALKGRTVTFFPDHGLFNKKTGKTCYAEWCERVERIAEVLPGKIRVSDLLENRLSNTERKDQDLADMLLIKDENTGIALTNEGYPVIWDFKME